jgi:hypothetical protein
MQVHAQFHSLEALTATHHCPYPLQDMTTTYFQLFSLLSFSSYPEQLLPPVTKTQWGIYLDWVQSQTHSCSFPAYDHGP